MRIAGIQAAMSAYNSKNKVNKVKNVEKNSLGQDKMKVSKQAKTFSAAFNAAKNCSEVREDKVNRLKDAIKNGEYKIDDEKIVDKLIDNMQIRKRFK